MSYIKNLINGGYNDFAEDWILGLFWQEAHPQPAL